MQSTGRTLTGDLCTGSTGSTARSRARVLADRGNLPHAGRLDSLDADRSRWEQSTEQRPLIAEPDTNWLVPVPRLELLTPVLGDVVREHDLAIVTSNDAMAPCQLDQDRSHDAIVPAGTTEASEPERTRTSIAASGSDRIPPRGPGADSVVREFRATLVS